jgi:prophage regulatory protein
MQTGVDHSERLLRANDVCGRLGISRSTFYAMIGAGNFPPGVKITTRRVGWPESVVQLWIKSRMAA